jgi:5-amino-6-(5-phosphoribosylamino)uracil reductase
MTIRVNMATSLDGKIAPAGRGKVRLGTDEDIHRMEVQRAWADAVVIGAGTVRAEDPPMQILDRALIAVRAGAGRPEQPAVVVVSRSLDLPVGRTFRGQGRHILATVDEAPEPPVDLAGLCEVWRLGRRRVDPGALVERLRGEGLGTSWWRGAVAWPPASSKRTWWTRSV